jgi:acetyltransferase-like isoleucine patch superfamily enzyme
VTIYQPLYPLSGSNRQSRVIRLRLLGVRIGRKCWVRRIHLPGNPWDIVISDGVSTDHDHGIEMGTPMVQQPLVSSAVQIGDSVWIGAGTIILEGVTIGDRAVIGAGAVVTRSVPSYAKVAGVPARILG